ncbi:ABATE domain-containing protein [Nonomuraea sp. NPDC050643]|uniref:CGNR zinc finger domain-containing protein n=1 Tax=Nonomuraea sp. NPDC050643 TaxID=3155660 RepID=UPI0033C227F9
MERWLALELASTIRHDGTGGVTDDLSTLQGTARWLRQQDDLLTEQSSTEKPPASQATAEEPPAGRASAGEPSVRRGGMGEPPAKQAGPGEPPTAQVGVSGLPVERAGVDGLLVDEEFRAEIVALRRAVRALFARAVSPAPPSRADAHRLMPVEEALAHVNGVAAREAVVPRLEWPQGEAPRTRMLSEEPDVRVRLLAALARAAIDFLNGPEREQLRACSAPRCVRYFLKSHGRQEWCKPSCGNRARAARHYERRRTSDEPATP